MLVGTAECSQVALQIVVAIMNASWQCYVQPSGRLLLQLLILVGTGECSQVALPIVGASMNGY